MARAYLECQLDQIDPGAIRVVAVLAVLALCPTRPIPPGLH